MARLCTFGAETNDVAPVSGTVNAEGVTCLATGVTITVSTANPRTGTYHYRVPSSQTSNGGKIVFAGALGTTYYGRIYMSYDNAPDSGSTLFMEFGDTSARVQVLLMSTGNIQVFDGTTSTDTGVNFPAGAYRRIEMGYRINAGASDYLEVLFDGSSIYSNSSLNITDSAPSSFWFGSNWVVGASRSTVDIDDGALNDSNGAAQNSWPGSGKVALLTPISDNARVGWTNGAGGTTNLFDDVNNAPPVGVAAPSAQPSQVKRAANNTTDTYDANLTDYTTAGIAAGDTLNAISLIGSAGYSNASTASQGLQLLSNPAISEFTWNTDGSAAGTYPSHWAYGSKHTGYTGLVSATVTVGTSPVMRLRKNTSSSSRSQFCCNMGAYVDYTPAASGTTYTKAGYGKEHGT